MEAISCANLVLIQISDCRNDLARGWKRDAGIRINAAEEYVASRLVGEAKCDVKLLLLLVLLFMCCFTLAGVFSAAP
ncbi:hypothetical protein VNO78_32292 [Psophocarpus tetragonolobus]|uniref:Uncharacterized protein n=1 Tax=Psophocarpus tetragonolobus TaxID=3891 RepID=A0AAN9RKJ8_PSOTE